MNPQSIYLRNVRTFDEVHLDLPVGLLAIIGQNGAGKSTLISAIDIALFGPEGRSLAPWYPRGPGTDELTIELVFEHAGELYRVRRSFSPKGRGASKLEFEHGLRGSWEPLTLESQTATQEEIERIVGLSRATFRASSYLAQGDAGAFCDAQPRDRKAILSEVVGLGDWTRWLERARDEKRGHELSVSLGRQVIERADAELVDRDDVEASRQAAADLEQELREQLTTTLSALTAAREAHGEARAKAERRAACERAHATASDAVAALQARIAQREEEIATLDERLASRDELAALAAGLEALQAEELELQKAATAWEERERLVGQAETLAHETVRMLEQAKEREAAAERVLERVGEEHCDRCGQVLGAEAAQRAAESYRAEAAGFHDKYDRAADELVALGKQVAGMPNVKSDDTRLRELYDLIRQAHDANVRRAALDEAATRRTSAAGELDVMRAELPTREGEAAVALADVEALGPHDLMEGDRELMEVQRLERAERGLRDKIEAAVSEGARCSDRLLRLEEIETEAAETRARIERDEKALEVLLAIERACGANGIPALILDSVAIPQVEAETTRLLRVLGGPATSASLRTQRETKAGGVSDTLDIVLMTDTGEAPYESFSGGERARIAFALRLALAQLLSGRKGADTGLLVVDEVEGLDAQGIAALVGVLEELQQSVARIIVVSHQAELRDAFPQSLTLVNVGGRSEILTLSPERLEV